MRSLFRVWPARLSDEQLGRIDAIANLQPRQPSTLFSAECRAEMQVAEYSAEGGGHYGWHHDVEWNGQGGRDRKLSVTVQLSAPTDYVGGDFDFEEVKTTANFRAKGTVLVFPSYLRHAIHPVTAGTRKALVAWFLGPRWR